MPDLRLRSPNCIDKISLRMLSETPLLFDEDENCCILQVTQEEGLHYSEKYSAVSTSVVEYDGTTMLLLVK